MCIRFSQPKNSILEDNRMTEDIPEANYLENIKNSFPESSKATYEGFKDYDRPEKKKKIGINCLYTIVWNNLHMIMIYQNIS